MRSGEAVQLSGDRETGWHSLSRDAQGRLVVRWLEYADPAPYDHATMLVFDADQERRLRLALRVSEGRSTSEHLLKARFQTYWDVKRFADLEGVSYERVVDFQP